MQSPEIYPKLTRIFHDLFDDSDIVLTAALTSHDVDGWDSLNHVRLVLSVQKAFGVRFSAAEISNLSNVGELVQLIEVKLKSSTSSDSTTHASIL